MTAETGQPELTRAIAAFMVERPDGQVVLGRPDLGIYVEIPEPAAILVEALQQGDTLAGAIARASDAAGEPVDGQEFLDALADAGLLERPGAALAAAPGRGRRIRWIEGVSPTVASRLFGRVAWTCYVIAALFSVSVLVLRPDLRPTFEAAWFVPDPALSLLLGALLTVVVGAVHEAWHWLAGRAVAVPAAFRFSHRGVWLVFETDLSQLVTKPRRSRYGPFLAGMAIEACILALALAARLLYRLGIIDLPGVLDRFLGAVVLGIVISLVWQWAAAFVRSDGYAVLANALGCFNLYRTTWLTVKDRIYRLSVAEQIELNDAHPRDVVVARWFGLIYLIGMIAAGWLYFNFIVPVLIGLGTWIANNLTAAEPNSPAFWKSAMAMLYLLTAYGSPILIARRERRLRRAGALM